MILLIIGSIIYLISIILAFIPPLRYLFMPILYNYNHLLFGFHKPIIKDYRTYKHDSKIIVFQHNSYYDLFALGAFFKEHNITGIIYDDFLKIPIIGTIFKKFNLIFINKSDKNNSQKIIDYIDNPKNTKYIGIAPAGDKGTVEDPIGSFKTGAFTPMKPVTPVLIRYKDNKGTWFNKNIKSWSFDIFRFRKFYQYELIILEEITAEGCKTPREFADKVEKYMKDANNQMKPPMT